MASILMPQQKSRSRKRHQFWCHRRKSAPIWSLVLSTTDKIRQFWAENKLFSRKAHKNRFFVLYPLRDKKISFNPQFLAFLDGYPLREKKFLSKWFIFGPSRCLPDGREIFKIIHKKTSFHALSLGRKKLFEKTLYFSRSRALPREGIFRKFRKPFIKSKFSWSTTWGEKNSCGKGAVFGYPRCLPIEGRKIFFQKA